MPSPHDEPRNLDIDRLLRLRLVVARVGELGLAGWWGTKDVLGSMGAMAYRRGFPRSHFWAQAKVVFEVARARCQERFPDPVANTLWNLPGSVEEQFDHAWGKWVSDEETWPSFFERLKAWSSPDLAEALKAFDLWTPEAASWLAGVHPTGVSVEVGQVSRLDDSSIGLLAVGFALGPKGELVVPFLRLREA